MKKTAIDYLYDKCSLKEKQKKEWYVPAIDAIVDYMTTLSCNDKSDIESDMQIFDGNTPADFISEFLKPFIPDGGTGTLDTGHYAMGFTGPDTNKELGSMPSYLPKVGFINQIKDRLVGEYIRQYSDLQVYNRDPKAIMERNQKLDSYLKKLVEKIILDLIQSKTSQEEIDEIDFDKVEKDFLEDWVDEETIQYQNRLNIINDLTKSDIQYIHAFIHWLATENVVTYRRLKGVDFKKEIVDPREYYRIPNSNTPFIKDDPAGMRVTYINIHDIIANYQDEISAEDVTYLKDLISSGKHGSSYGATSHQIMSRRMNLAITPNKDIHLFSSSDTVPQYHIVMQSVKPIKILTYSSLDGSIREMEVDKGYTLSPDIGDLNLRSIDTFETIEFTRIGEKDAGIYIKPTVLDVQIGQLPYNGTQGYLGTGKCNPIPRRVAGLEALYKYYTLVQQKAVGKYRAWTIIPESILLDSEEMTKIDRLNYAKKDDLLIINSEDAGVADLQALRALVSQGTERFISMLGELRATIRREGLDEAGMNEERYGDGAANAGKAVTEYAITRATTASIGLFYTFNKVKEEDAMLDLAYSNQIFINGYKGSYFDKSTKKVVYVEIPSKDIDPTKIGVFVKNSIQEQEKKQAMMDFAFNMGQAGDTIVAIEALDSENATQIKKLVKDTVAKKEELDENFRRYEEEMKVQAEEIISKRDKDKQAHEASINSFREEMANIRKVLELDTQVVLKQMELENSDNEDVTNRLKDLEERKLEMRRLENNMKAYQNTFNNITKEKSKTTAK